MSPNMTHVEFARENEEFASSISSEFGDKHNWAVTVNFYSYVHYVEEILDNHGLDSRSHNKRKENIRKCSYVDNSARKLYRSLEDLSRDARYECIRMNEEDVEKSEEKLEEGKDLLGFGESGSSTKYNI